jgi:hypothetical protein
MEGLIAVAALWVVAVGYFIARPAYVKVRERMSPKYAAARKVRAAQKSALAEAGRKRVRENEALRLKSWATEHPDDETAQAYLATLPADVKSGGAAANEDIESVLRGRQQDEDNIKERLRQRRLEEVEHLQWALKHPDSDVARRHLETVLVEARRNAQLGINQSQAAQTVADIEAVLELASNNQQ